MKKLPLQRILLLALISIGPFFVTGCASTDRESNQSTRPWNQPRGWESGVPGMMQQQGRY